MYRIPCVTYNSDPTLYMIIIIIPVCLHLGHTWIDNYDKQKFYKSLHWDVWDKLADKLFLHMASPIILYMEGILTLFVGINLLWSRTGYIEEMFWI